MQSVNATYAHRSPQSRSHPQFPFSNRSVSPNYKQENQPILVQQTYTPNKEQNELMSSQIQILKNENKMLKIQLETSKNQISQLQSKLDEKPSLLKTTTFELVVLQKALEQLKTLKAQLQTKTNKEENNTQQSEETVELLSILKSKVTMLEEQNSKLTQENSELQSLINSRQIPFNQTDTKNRSSRSPLKVVHEKATLRNPYRSQKEQEI